MPLLCFASPKGGVGKTTLAANLAWGLAAHGARVVALDLDPQNALRLHFGIALRDGAGLMPVLRQAVGHHSGTWQSALRQTGAGVWLLPYGQSDMATALADTSMLAAMPDLLVAILRAILVDPATILIVDTPPGPSAALRSVLPLADLLVTVLLSDATSIALIPMVERGHAYGADHACAVPERHGFVLNQVSPLSRLSRATTEAAGRQLGHRLLGTISRDESVAEAIASQQSVIGYAPGSRAARDLTQMTTIIAERLEVAARPPPHVPRPSQFGHLVRAP